MSKRLSVSLDAVDENTVERLSRPGPERDALLSLVDPDGGRVGSEASVLRALARVGADTVRDRVLAHGYEEMAREHREHDAERRALRARRVDREAARD